VTGRDRFEVPASVWWPAVVVAGRILGAKPEEEALMAMAGMPTVKLRSGEPVPVLGLGTWHMAESTRRRADEIAAIRAALDLGMNLIDTAEIYARGRAEELVREAIAGRRDEVFLVSKVAPRNATRRAMRGACERSLERLGTDRLDLYLLHWPGPAPIEETFEAFESLRERGLIRHWGVSNLDYTDMVRAANLVSAANLQTDQVLYNLSRRAPEVDLLPWCRDAGIPLMAYSPVDRGGLVGHRELVTVADRHGATAAQVALAWVLRYDNVFTIPMSRSVEHVRENRGAVDLRLTEDDLADLDRAFPPPTGPSPLGRF
jgi:diketogulonate reductase-like aldo/keto reductase